MFYKIRTKTSVPESNKVTNLQPPIKKAQVFSDEFSEVFKNTILAEHLQTAVSKAFQCASFNLNNAGFFEGNLQILGFDLNILGRTNSNLKLKLKIC